MLKMSIAELEKQGAILDIKDGNHGAKHPRGDDFVSDGIPFIVAKNIRNGSMDLSGCSFITLSQAQLLKKGRARKGDVLLTHKGTVGEVAIVPPIDDFIMLSPQVTYYRVDQSKMDNRFLKYAFSESSLQAQLRSYSAQSTRPYISITSQRGLEVYYCPLDLQNKIASILSAYDDLIENNLRRIRILEEMAQLIYREWFVKFRFPGHEKVNMVDSPQGKIPEEWEIKSIEEVANDVRRSVKPEEMPPDTPYIGLEHLPRKSIALSHWGFASDVQSTKLAFHKGEILFGKIRPYFHKVGVAPLEGICSSDTIVISPHEDVYFPVLLCCVSSEEFVAHATQTSKGTKMPRADWNVLKEYPLLFPAEPLLTRFNQHIFETLNLIHNLIFKNINLRQARDLLLPKLISGQVEVS